MDLTPKQQASEAIRQAEAILIVTGQRPNIDQVSSMVALALILRKFGKKVTAVVTDQMPGSAGFLTAGQIERNLTGLRDFIVQLDLSRAEVDKLKYTVEEGKLNIHITPFTGSFNQQDVSFKHGDFHYDLVIAMGVPSRNKLDRLLDQNPGLLRTTPLLNFDFHRINENYGAINLVDTNAATLSEMLISLAESLQPGLLDETIATAMLTGIIAATDRFSGPHTTAKSMTVAAQLMAAGAKQQQIIKALYSGSGRDGRDGRDRDRDKKTDRPVGKTADRSPRSESQRVESPVSATPDQVLQAPANSPYAVPGELPNLAVAPTPSNQGEIKDAGPDLAAIDWNAVMPHASAVKPEIEELPAQNSSSGTAEV